MNNNDARIEVKRGDIWYVDFSPVLKSEQGGVRPALVIQNNMGNKFSSTITVVPITSVMSKRSLPTHVRIEEGEFGLNRQSIISCEALRTVDKVRFRGEKLGEVDENTLLKVENAIMLNLGMLSF